MHSLMRIFGPYLFHTTNNKKIRIRYDFLRMNVRRTDHINITPDKMNKFSVIFKLSFINTIFFYLPILANNSPVDYVNTLVGTQSKFELSTGNTYPAIAMPWGMNFWTPQTGDMGDGWTYTYNADKIKGFKQTHQPSPWMNDYGQFALMPVTCLLYTSPSPRD